MLVRMNLTSAHCGPGRNRESVSKKSSAISKIDLFRSLFRGREDVYPLRFESRRTGRAGYQPACGNEWIPGVCDKPRIKCSECLNQSFLAVTHEVIRWHLSGADARGRPFVMGVYPMLLDETCHFLVADFDKASWQDDVSAFRETCREFGVPASIERSRSGQGGHVWLFFDEAIPAPLARSLGSCMLTTTLERRPEIGLRSYDRFFPNQDTLPKGGFGNLVALPLQRVPRNQGNSLFLDESLEPHVDQWAYLDSIERISRSHAEDTVVQAGKKGGVMGIGLSIPVDNEIEPWTAPASRRRKEPPITGILPKEIELVLNDQIYIKKEGLPPSLINRLIRLAAFQNPLFYKAQSMRMTTFNQPRVIGCAEDYPLHIGLPRGCMEALESMLKDLHIKQVLRDERVEGASIDCAFNGELRPEQWKAIEALAQHDTGVLSAPPGFGKTVIAASLIARRGVNCLVVVHLRELLEQWIERLSTFLDLPVRSMGQIGGGRKKPSGLVDVALIQSLVRKGVVDDSVGKYGQVVFDECHHLSAKNFEQVARRVKAKYVLGLSATVTRKDGHQPIIFMQCGPVRYGVDPKKQAALRPFKHRVIVRPTGFRSTQVEETQPRLEFQALYSQLTGDSMRNEMICADVVSAFREGRSPVVLTERTEHLAYLADKLKAEVPHIIQLQGGMGRKELRAARESLATSPQEGRVLLATGRYLGEGFDDPRLDTLFLTLPVSWRGTIAQYAGRLHRLYEGKREVRIYDYADLNVPMFSSMFNRRCRGYEAVGYTIELPASAIPGWPVEVPLPIDPAWKKEFGSGIRRLIRDGLNADLGDLFVRVARLSIDGTEGVDRARSASEAFLFQRLDTLNETRGRFGLNQELPIPFDGFGKMEVDFLFQKERIVIELDGDQHLSDPEAYRRDRRKDALLQENGYFVMRFLARDLGKYLNETLDTILRALERRVHL